MPRITGKRFGRTVAAAILLLALLAALGGCGRRGEPNAERQGRPADRDALEGQLPRMGGGELPPDQPVWREGTLFSRESKDATILARTYDLDAVYRRALADHPDLRGRLTLRFIVHPDGSVDAVEALESTWSDTTAATLTDSMVARVRRWTFPPGAPKPVRVVQPWRFEP